MKFNSCMLFRLSYIFLHLIIASPYLDSRAKELGKDDQDTFVISSLREVDDECFVVDAYCGRQVND